MVQLYRTEIVMPKTLLIPDVHEKLRKLNLALSPERLRRVSRVVFLGDFFDTFKKFDEQRVQTMCHLLLEYVQAGVLVDGKRLPTDVLMGNHEAHYFFAHEMYRCTGYEREKHHIIRERIPRSVLERFKLFTTVGPYTVSHAGFQDSTRHIASESVWRNLLRWALDGEYVGGIGGSGGPLWLRWWDFGHMHDMPQIVGHTPCKDDVPQSKGLPCMRPLGISCDERERADWCENCLMPRSWCIDTGLRHVMIVDEETGEVEIEEVS